MRNREKQVLLLNTFSLSAAEASGARGFRLFLLPRHQLIRRGPRAHPADGARQENQPWTTHSHLTWYSLSRDIKSIIYLPAPNHLFLFSLSLCLNLLHLFEVYFHLFCWQNPLTPQSWRFERSKIAVWTWGGRSGSTATASSPATTSSTRTNLVRHCFVSISSLDELHCEHALNMYLYVRRICNE